MTPFELSYSGVRTKIEQLDFGVDEWIIVSLFVAIVVGLAVVMSTRRNRRGAVDHLRAIGAFTVLGVGVRLLGIERSTTPGHSYATTWLTAFYLPVLPLRRDRVEFVEPRPGLESAWIRHEPTGLVGREVLRTYLYGYVLFPALVLAPMSAGWLLAHFHPAETMDLISLVSLALMLSWIPWLVVSLWLIVRWDQKRKVPHPSPDAFGGHRPIGDLPSGRLNTGGWSSST